MRSTRISAMYLTTGILLWMVGFFAMPSMAGEWSEDIQLTVEAPEMRNVHIGVDSKSNVHLVWRQDTADEIMNIWYTKVDSLGQTIVSPMQIAETSGCSKAPNLAVDSRDHVHIFWREQGTTGFDVWYTKLDTSGETLILPKMVVDANGTIMDYLLPAVGVDYKDNLHIVWDQSDDNTELHYTKLDDEGNILVEDVYLSWQGWDARQQALALDSWGNVHILWADGRGTPASGELIYTKLDNDGNFLVDNLSLTPEPDGKDSRGPDAVVDSEGNVHITFMDNRDPGYDVWYIKLDNNGNFMIEPMNLDPSSTSILGPEFAIDCWDTLHLVLSDLLRYDGVLKYMKLSPDGSVKDTLTLIADKIVNYQDVATSPNGNVSVAWRDTRHGIENQCVYFKYYDADCGCPDVSVYLTPDEAMVPRGGKLGFDILVRNNTGINQTFQAWTDVILPNGKSYKGNPVLGPKTVPLQPRKWVIRHITQQVPGNAPLGDYVYMGKVGTWPDSLIDQDQFEFTVVEARKARAESPGTPKATKDWEVIEGNDW